MFPVPEDVVPPEDVVLLVPPEDVVLPVPEDVVPPEDVVFPVPPEDAVLPVSAGQYGIFHPGIRYWENTLVSGISRYPGSQLIRL